MNIYIKQLFENIDFNTSDIFNKEESLYNYDEKDSIIFRNIEDKILNDKPITEEESIYYFKVNKEIPEFILNKLLKGIKVSEELIKGISKANVKYKVSTKDELRSIILKYFGTSSTTSLNWIDTSRITNMSKLFYNTNYNGDISEWDTSNVKDMSFMFFNALRFNLPIGNWNVSNVTNMNGMFAEAYEFNQPIGDWNVSKVNKAHSMFYYAEAFNQDISNWNVNNIIDMERMFYNASNFNLNISFWNLHKLVITKNMFTNCPIKKEYIPKIKIL